MRLLKRCGCKHYIQVEALAVFKKMLSRQGLVWGRPYCFGHTAFTKRLTKVRRPADGATTKQLAARMTYFRLDQGEVSDWKWSVVLIAVAKVHISLQQASSCSLRALENARCTCKYKSRIGLLSGFLFIKQAHAVTYAFIISRIESKMARPSVLPSSGSTARSGCGIMPNTFFLSLLTPAMLSRLPLQL